MTTDQPSPAEEPDSDEPQEPSTEKDVDEEPRAPQPADAEPDHEAVGIGVIDDDPDAG